MNSVFLLVLSKNSVMRGPNFSEKFLISAKKASEFSVKILFLKKILGNYTEIFPRCSIEASFRAYFSFHFKNYMLPLSPVCPKSFPICPWKRGTRFDSAFWNHLSGASDVAGTTKELLIHIPDFLWFRPIWTSEKKRHSQAVSGHDTHKKHAACYFMGLYSVSFDIFRLLYV